MTNKTRTYSDRLDLPGLTSQDGRAHSESSQVKLKERGGMLTKTPNFQLAPESGSYLLKLVILDARPLEYPRR